jgi:protein-disulfide isomerase
MDIEIYALPGNKADQVLMNAEAAAAAFGEDAAIVLINNYAQMLNAGVRHTPTVVVGGRLKSSQRIPSLYEFTSWIREELEVPVEA